MQTIEIDFEGKSYTLELYTSKIGNKNVYTVLVEEPDLVHITGRVISYLRNASSPLEAVRFASERTPFKGRLKTVIAQAIEKKVNSAPVK
jgi:hypothetical protein